MRNPLVSDGFPESMLTHGQRPGYLKMRETVKGYIGGDSNHFSYAEHMPLQLLPTPTNNGRRGHGSVAMGREAGPAMNVRHGES
jgi:hypothetical protein